MRKPWLNYHPIRNNNQVNFHLSGASLFAKIESLIHQSQKIIHFQFYIFDEDNTGSRIINSLIDAAKRGVSVWLVVDGYASNKISADTIEKLRTAGIHFKKFSPIKTYKFRIGRRMHHKIIYIDHEVAIIGGMNIADKYSGAKEHHPWLDFAIEMNGPICDDIKIICESIWSKNNVEQMKRLSIDTKQNKKGNISLQLLQNDWWRRRVEISSAYRESIRYAKNEIIIVAAYFFPSNRMRRLIKKAIQRGVKIKIFTVSNSDVLLLGPALKYLYSWMLNNKIEIYEWQPSIMHGKLMLTDDTTCNIGSYNLNALSDYGSLELNVMIIDKEITLQVKSILELLISNETRSIKKDEFENKTTYFKGIFRWFSYHIVRMLLKILFIFMQRSRFSKATKK